MARVREMNARIAIAENEPLIESSFRRLLASIESEREKIRSTWQEIDKRSEEMHEDLEGLRRDTDEWCKKEQNAITERWAEIDKLRERMSVLNPVDSSDILSINCSGTFFNVPKNLLCSIEGSLLNHMFSDAFIHNVPVDKQGFHFLDFNPICFGIILEYLQRPPDAPPPPIPPEQQMNMDLLVEALRLKSFHRQNHLQTTHTTSLRLTPGKNMLEATHEGWQIIAAEYPLSMAGISFFEVTVLANPNVKGGLAIGVCGHKPHGKEVNTIRLTHSVLFNSCVGLVGDSIALENVEKNKPLKEGVTLGVKHDVHTHTISWYYNKIIIGTCSMVLENLEHMQQLYPVFGLLYPGTKIQIDFDPVAHTSQNAKAGLSVKPGSEATAKS
eukprot:TRINITY_DN74725_c0_g1_i1.p1 TRINITY_DN74725_c0_g1~~TRINITY_DN74725_c0_g1_i1.p1  ORF type:complete len:385 (+),score=94.44 TRINITY_DN74725_c0_g1_i1:131-1285(+)